MSTNKQRIYWDTSVWIAWTNNRFGSRDLLTALLRRAEAGKIEIVVSSMTMAEFAPRDKNIDLKLEAYLKRPYFVPVQTSFVVAKEARDLVRAHRSTNLKGADAVHIASALRASADYLFSYDNDLIRLDGLVPGIKISEPSMLGQQEFDFTAAGQQDG